MSLKAETPIQFLKGVGPKLGSMLRKKGIETVGDLIEYYPRAYEDRRAARSLSTLQPGDLVSVEVEVLDVKSFGLGRSRRKAYDVYVRDATGRIHCKYFRVPYKGFFERFQAGQKVRVIGKVTEYRGRLEFHHPDIQTVKPGEVDEDRLLPIYPETEGLTSQKIRKLVETAFEELRKELPENPNALGTEVLPEWLRDKYQLISQREAIEKLHFPDRVSGREFIEGRSPAHRRVIFEEFFWLEIFLAARRSGIRREKAPEMEMRLELARRLRDSLPFALTGAQNRCFKEIVKDLCQPHPMHRMIQGDVGAGKTLVALLAAVFTHENGAQSALMVPTEILAEQHYNNAVKFLTPLGMKVGLLTGSMKAAEKRQVLEELGRGEIQLIVGTHALIQDPVEFANLALVIVDEQHRFGVQQRNKLKQKGLSPHFLLMTATPIPRTLAMTVYGDLDVSILDERPKGRQPIVTRVTYESQRAKVWGFLKSQLAQGRQVYVVYPLVEESEKIDLKDAITQFERIRGDFPECAVGLLHGKMTADEKEEVMKAFRANEIQILVATTVIEVGVDVPNANVMLIEHAERFGLSQLHQLRGRVGRGSQKSYCVLMLGVAVSEEARERCRIMEQTDDGFKIAEADLEFRGPGEFMGARQSGLPGFRMANLVRDLDILREAREAAWELIAQDPELQRPEHHQLREELFRTQGRKSLAGVG